MEKDITLEFCDFLISLFDEKEKDIPLNARELHMWFKHHSLSEVKGFPLWKYKINDIEYNYSLKRGNDEGWNVYKIEKPNDIYFSFGHSKGLEFIKDFEKNLTSKLETDK